MSGTGAYVLSVLSPQMVYAMTEWPRMRAVALKMGFSVRAWRSPWVAEEEWRAAVGRAGWSGEVMDAVEAVPVTCRAWVGRPNHFPFSLVVSGGRVHAWPIWGVLPDEAWGASLDCRRRALAGEREGCGP